jgi:hypothetical protein
MAIYNFRDSVVKGSIGENMAMRIMESLKKYLGHDDAILTPYDKRCPGSLTLQRNGVDGVLMKDDSELWKFEIKTRDFRQIRDDILIETVSILEQNKPGWFYTSKADWILYQWRGKDGIGIIDGYVIMIKDETLRRWFEHNKNAFEIKDSHTDMGGEKYTTRNRVVMVRDFPIGTLLWLFPPEPKGLDKYM